MHGHNARLLLLASGEVDEGREGFERVSGNLGHRILRGVCGRSVEVVCESAERDGLFGAMASTSKKKNQGGIRFYRQPVLII